MDTKKIKTMLSNTLSFLPDREYCVLTFVLKQNRFPNLSHPIYFNDKLLKLKLTTRNPLLKKLVDKYEVREFVKDRIGGNYLIPLIGVYSDPSEVNFDSLPNKFALKPTAGSQQNLICTDKRTINWERTSDKIRKWLKFDSYKRTREWPYKDLPSRFVIEEYIEDSKGATIDYKFWCFNGSPKILQLDIDRFSDHKRNFYIVENFEEINDLVISHKRFNGKIPKPKNFDYMIQIATALSSNFEFVRVDLYNIDGQIFFGEMTFYPGNCNERITPFKYERVLGEMLTI